MIRISPSRAIGSLLLLASVTLTELAWPASGYDGPSSPVPAGLLDGLKFNGRYGPQEKPRDRPDTLRFEAGRFWSEDYLQHGFSSSPYWIRLEGDSIHFRAVLESVDNGTLAFEGMVRGPRIAATVTWSKKRWYWSIHQQYAYEGSLTGQAALAPTPHPFQARLVTTPRQARADAE